MVEFGKGKNEPFIWDYVSQSAYQIVEKQLKLYLTEVVGLHPKTFSMF